MLRLKRCRQTFWFARAPPRSSASFRASRAQGQPRRGLDRGARGGMLERISEPDAQRTRKLRSVTLNPAAVDATACETVYHERA